MSTAVLGSWDLAFPLPRGVCETAHRQISPTSAARRLLLQRLLKTVEAKLAPVSNGLRYEYTYSLQETYRRFRSTLNGQMDDIIGELRRILQQAAERKSATEENMRRSIKTLSHRLDRLVELQRMLSESHD